MGLWLIEVKCEARRVALYIVDAPSQMAAIRWVSDMSGYDMIRCCVKTMPVDKVIRVPGEWE
jgi:hypothetical protein